MTVLILDATKSFGGFIFHNISGSWDDWYMEVDENNTLIGFINLATD